MGINDMLIGWLLIYTAIVFAGAVSYGSHISIKAGIVMFITVEITLTLFTVGAYLMCRGQ